MSLVPFRRLQTPAYALSGFDQFDRLFGRMLDNALTNLAAPAPALTDLALRLDVSETDKAYTIRADLPGVDEKDLEISLEDGVLTIAGEKKAEETAEGVSFHRMERTAGSFRRALALPADAREDGITARAKNGVLEITVAKREQPQKTVRRIAVETA